MSDLNFAERIKLERLLGMQGGYVLTFSNSTFSEFVAEAAGLDIYDERFARKGTSKANRLRVLWEDEPNHVVGKLLAELLECAKQLNPAPPPAEFEACERIAARLREGASVEALDAIAAEDGERDFELLVREVRNAINRNEPEAGLDRLHTYVSKLLRKYASRHGLTPTRDDPLHSVMGAYAKVLRSEGLIATPITDRFLQTTVSLLEAFNRVRNDHSLAHDNSTMTRAESMLIFNHVCGTVRFIRTLEEQSARSRGTPAPFADGLEDTPL